MNKNISIIENPTIENASGFISNAVCCEIKKKDKLDLGIVFSKEPAATYAMFTTNKFQAAPIIVSKEHLKNNRIQAIVVNSGNANACTGELGIKNAEMMCENTGKILGINKNDVLVASTGVIGQHLPMEKINNGIEELKNKINEKNDNNFSKAIMTTDTMMKIVGVNVRIEDKTYSIVGTCKGSGMIHPNMATLLAFIFTDANISENILKSAFTQSIKKSLNSVTIDGDTSTNDTAIISTNNLAKNKIIDNKNSESYNDFCEALDYITINLAKKIAFDGEGATKFIEIEVQNAKSETDAKQISMSVAKSSLVKTAFFGEDANWGRIVCAMGYSGIDFDTKKVDVSFGNLLVCKNGENFNFSEDEAKKILEQREIKVIINLNSGNKKWTVWTSDLSYDYVKINGSYRT